MQRRVRRYDALWSPERTAGEMMAKVVKEAKVWYDNFVSVLQSISVRHTWRSRACGIGGVCPMSQDAHQAGKYFFVLQPCGELQDILYERWEPVERQGAHRGQRN